MDEKTEDQKNPILVPDNIIEQLKFFCKNNEPDLSMAVLCNEDINLTLISRRGIPFPYAALTAVSSLINALIDGAIMADANNAALIAEAIDENIKKH